VTSDRGLPAYPLRMRLATGLLALLVLAACREAPPKETAPAEAAFPAPGELNAYVVDVLRTYPTDGTHRYWWPKTGPWSGNARTIRYDGEVLFEGDPEGRCYCCGLTFEVFLQAFEAWCQDHGRPYRIPGYGADEVRAFKDDWFGSNGNRQTLFNAVTSRGLGRRVEDWDDARAGDFVQLWRHSGSGHSVVFLDWVRDDGEIVGLRYWSCQGSTDGIGERVERFGEDGSSMKRDEFYLVRIGGVRH
jgi:hypothetical protein